MAIHSDASRLPTAGPHRDQPHNEDGSVDVPAAPFAQEGSTASTRPASSTGLGKRPGRRVAFRLDGEDAASKPRDTEGRRLEQRVVERVSRADNVPTTWNREDVDAVRQLATLNGVHIARVASGLGYEVVGSSVDTTFNVVAGGATTAELQGSGETPASFLDGRDATMGRTPLESGNECSSRICSPQHESQVPNLGNEDGVGSDPQPRHWHTLTPLRASYHSSSTALHGEEREPNGGTDMSPQDDLSPVLDGHTPLGLPISSVAVSLYARNALRREARPTQADTTPLDTVGHPQDSSSGNSNVGSPVDGNVAAAHFLSITEAAGRTVPIVTGPTMLPADGTWPDGLPMVFSRGGSVTRSVIPNSWENHSRQAHDPAVQHFTPSDVNAVRTFPSSVQHYVVPQTMNNTLASSTPTTPRFEIDLVSPTPPGLIAGTGNALSSTVHPIPPHLASSNRSGNESWRDDTGSNTSLHTLNHATELWDVTAIHGDRGASLTGDIRLGGFRGPTFIR